MYEFTEIIYPSWLCPKMRDASSPQFLVTCVNLNTWNFGEGGSIILDLLKKHPFFKHVPYRLNAKFPIDTTEVIGRGPSSELMIRTWPGMVDLPPSLYMAICLAIIMFFLGGHSILGERLWFCTQYRFLTCLNKIIQDRVTSDNLIGSNR